MTDPSLGTPFNNELVRITFRRNMQVWRASAACKLPVFSREPAVILSALVITPCQENADVDHPPHPHQDRPVRERKCRTDLESGMRAAHDPAKGVHFGKAASLQGCARIYLLFGMGFGRRDRGLSQQRRA